MVILDTSVVLKWFVDEEKSQIARDIRDRYIRGEISINVPDLLLHEVANALLNKQSFTEHAVTEVVQSIFDMGINIIAPVPHIMKKAINLSYKNKITEYDAHYLALALDMNYKLITADKKFYEKIKKYPSVEFL